MHNALVALIVCWLVVLTLTLLGRGRSDAQLTQLARLTRGGEATSVELEMHKVSTTSDEQWRFPPSMTFLEALRTYENKGGRGGTERGDRPSTTRHSRPATPSSTSRDLHRERQLGLPHRRAQAPQGRGALQLPTLYDCRLFQVGDDEPGALL